MAEEICPHCKGRLFLEYDPEYGQFIHCFCGFDEMVGEPRQVRFEGRSGRHSTDPLVRNSESTMRYRFGMKARAVV